MSVIGNDIDKSVISWPTPCIDNRPISSKYDAAARLQTMLERDHYDEAVMEYGKIPSIQVLSKHGISLGCGTEYKIVSAAIYRQLFQGKTQDLGVTRP